MAQSFSIVDFYWGGEKVTIKPGGTFKLGGMVNKALQDNGVICRAVVDAICFCPPMIITADQIDDLLAAVSASLDRVAADLGL